jgi:hypothetical protein
VVVIISAIVIVAFIGLLALIRVLLKKRKPYKAINAALLRARQHGDEAPQE